MKFYKSFLLSVFMTYLVLIFGGCSKVEEPDHRERDYGYVQFKLYKEASYQKSKALVQKLEYLHDATKIKITLQYDGKLISQTLVLSAADEAAAEYGIRSEKLKMLEGRYKVINYTLYDKLDEKLYETSLSSEAVFDVVPGGLEVYDILVDAVGRGEAEFTLVKDFSNFEPKVKSVNREYTFDEIKTVSIRVKSQNTGKETLLEHLKTEFSIHFDETDDIEDYQVATLKCDTLLTMEAGKYTILSYSTYDKKKALLETMLLSSRKDFDIFDNRTTKVNVPVSLHQTDAYIQDYYVLRDIWQALDGENWYYIGENFNTGTNWDFNKDVDLWGDQPGVQLHSNGRVALIDLSNFGFSGEMPESLGNLTELVELYLGTHNDTNVFTYEPDEQGDGTLGVTDQERLKAAKAYLRATHPVQQFSEPIARALTIKGVDIPEIAMYKKFSEKEIFDDKKPGHMRVRPMDTNPGTIVNGLTKLPESIGNLKKLQKLCIANSTLASLPESMKGMESLTDLELYNLPKMVKFPEVLAQMPALIQANLSSNPQWGEAHATYQRHDGAGNGTESDFGLDILADENSPASKTLQMLYMNGCGLTEVTKDIKNLKSLGLLSLSKNDIDKVYSFGSDVVMVQLYLDHNKIEKLEMQDGHDVFCGMDDVESISFSNNRLTKFPDIFTAKSNFIMKSVDFSYNNITEVENAMTDKDGPCLYKGINVETLTLTNNPIEVFPIEFAKSKSRVAFFNMRGCSLSKIPEEAFDLEKESSEFLMSLDFSYNHLKTLPETFNATNIPYLYGLELSYNEFSKFPYTALDCSGLTVFGIRGQRDKAGQRCLSEWPLNIRQHTGLRGFYIGSNNLGKIDDTISPICYYLEVSDNPDIILDASSVCYEYSIGMYYLIYDKDQDIRGCDIMKQ